MEVAATIRNDPGRTLIPSPTGLAKEVAGSFRRARQSPQGHGAKSHAHAEISLIPGQPESHQDRPGANPPAPVGAAVQSCCLRENLYLRSPTTGTLGVRHADAIGSNLPTSGWADGSHVRAGRSTYLCVARLDNISSRVHPAGGRRKLPPAPGNPRKTMSEMPCSGR